MKIRLLGKAHKAYEKLDKKIAEMVDMLPVEEQHFAYTFIRRMVLAWDPDFTKLTVAEAADLETAAEEYKKGDYIDFDALD